MDVFKIIGIGLIGACISIVLKQIKPEYAISSSIITGVAILIYIVLNITGVITLLEDLMQKSGINSTYIQVILKITGIAYVSEFAVNICKDAGESAIAGKIELGSKVIIAVLSLPIISALLGVINQLI